MLKQASGFSLIETAIAITILAFLMVMGLPAYNTFINNSRIRATAEGFYTGLQSARASAVQRNAQVQFILTTDDIGHAGVDPNTTNLSTSALNYIVRTPDPAVPGNYVLLNSKPAAEGTGSVALASTVSTVTFTPLGATTLGAAATLQFTNPAGGACAASSGPMRCLNVVVSIGGQIKMCDPAISAASDTRKC
ncbi:MAG TPA: GspH/FimT family pseudopilin [Burkholderiales bacterium]|nr:GspH/FimT family pseudopilin [Burkholderiales bacterium]